MASADEAATVNILRQRMRRDSAPGAVSDLRPHTTSVNDSTTLASLDPAATTSIFTSNEQSRLETELWSAYETDSRRRRRSNSVNVPLTAAQRVELGGRLEPATHLTAQCSAIPDDKVNIITNITTKLTTTTTAAAVADDDKQTRDATASTNTPRRSRRSSRIQPAGTLLYTASGSDSLSSIAARHKTTTSELVYINRLMTNMIFPGQMLFVPDEDYVRPIPDSLSIPATTTTDSTTNAASADEVDEETDADDAGESDDVSISILFASQAQYLGHSDQDGAGGVCPVTGMLTMYEDQLRFDKAALADADAQPSDEQQNDETKTSLSEDMTCVRLDRLLVNSVDISDNSPRPLKHHPATPPPSVSRSNDKRRQVDGDFSQAIEFLSVKDDTATTTTTTTGATTTTVATTSSSNGPTTTTATTTTAVDAASASRKRRKTTWSRSRQATVLDFDSQVCGEVRYVTVKLGLVSTQVGSQQDKPTISLLIKSFLPTVIQHYFALPTQRAGDLVEVLLSCGLRVCDADKVTESEESQDIVSSELVRVHSQKSRVRPVYRRTLSAAELYNLPLPELSHPSNIFTDNHIRTLREHLPARADGRSWLLVYSSDRDGFSLQTLYRRSSLHTSCPVLLIIRDQLLRIFGAVLPCELRLSDTFYGSGELFLFTFFPAFKCGSTSLEFLGHHGSAQKFGWTGKNCYFLKGNTDSLSIGAGDGAFGLWLDDCLYRGRTDRCDTFDNEPLTDCVDFIIDCLEAWSFQ